MYKTNTQNLRMIRFNHSRLNELFTRSCEVFAYDESTVFQAFVIAAYNYSARFYGGTEFCWIHFLSECGYTGSHYEKDLMENDLSHEIYYKIVEWQARFN